MRIPNDSLTISAIDVNALCPGYIDTPFIATVMQNTEMAAAVAAAHPWNAVGRPEDIADAALFLCSDES
jgi:NAD(P)-dependent dehydrogenase (short-subunit alcohol dehydrogenase family)